jgi:peptidoglycan/LPS O-acetylase OafA/YrhL
MQVRVCEAPSRALTTTEISRRFGREATKLASVSYKPQLDALRAIATAAVLIEHFAPKTYLSWYVFRLGYVGLLGVLLFFVLSGYLITGILLSARDSDFRTALKRFYVRRTLRIFPIYFLTLAILFVIGLPSVTNYLFWHTFYVSNVLFLLEPRVAAPIAHFWTLSVEEQFYLIWPLLILIVPYKLLLRVILGAIVIGVVWKVWIIETLGHHLAGGLPVVSCFDSLAVGALLAYLERDQTFGQKKQEILFRFLGIGTLIMLAQIVIWVSVDGKAFAQVTGFLGPSLIFAWFVGNAAAGFQGWFGAVLGWQPLRFIGKISYGIYLYHYFMPRIFEVLLKALGLPQPPEPVAVIFTCALTIGTAALSWHLVEKPILRLKERFAADDMNTAN